MKRYNGIRVFILFFFIGNQVYSQPPIAEGHTKFLGCVHSDAQVLNFANYWNQITPENGGKWGSVESTRDNMNWTEIDAAYAYAMTNDIPFRLHVLVWGNQQPNWIAVLDSAQQHEEIEEWFSLCGGRFPNADYVEVVNEPFRDPPDSPADGGYINALGGAGVTGFDWVLEAFRMARIYFPSAKLMLNEYAIENDLANTLDYRELAELLNDSSLIDGIGIQAHAFSTRNTTAATLKRMVDTLATVGLPIQVTEMDVDGPTDLIQVQDYQRIFPVYWEHPAIEGITLWGFRQGMWRTAQLAYLIYNNGTERPALKWLRAYVDSSFTPATEVNVSTQEGVSVINSDNGTLNMIATVLPDTATIDEVEWRVNNTNASITAEGLLTGLQDGTVTVTAIVEDGSGTSNTMDITISNQVVGTNFTDYLESLEFYPNPVTNGSITIPVAENLSEIRVFDLLGNMMSDQHIIETGSAIIEINCKPGIYILQLSGKGHEVNRKIVVQ